MDIDEAIKELTEPYNERQYIVSPRFMEALQLGIEALKARRWDRKVGHLPPDDLLPGETEGIGKGGKMTEYIVPQWCKMPLPYHNDGVGGCWGISYGYVATKGEDYCKTCQFYKPNLAQHNTATTPYSVK